MFELNTERTDKVLNSQTEAEESKREPLVWEISLLSYMRDCYAIRV